MGAGFGVEGDQGADGLEEEHGVCLVLAVQRDLVQGSGFRVHGSGFRVQGSGFRVQGLRVRVQGSGLNVKVMDLDLCEGLRLLSVKIEVIFPGP